MTVKQKQGLLLFLGFYEGDVDGIWGPLSEDAQARFHRTYGMDPEEVHIQIQRQVPEVSTLWWDQIQFFTPEEFACKCGQYCDGYPAQMEKALIQTADRVRAHFGLPAVVSSGLRCPRHNANVGGVSNSRHLSGKAMDFRIRGHSAGEVLAFVQQQPEVRYAYAIDDSYVHMDVQ